MQVIFNKVEYEKQNKGKANWEVAKISYSANGENRQTRIMSFGDGAEAFAALRKLNPGDAIEVETKQNGAYLNWVGIKPAEGATAPSRAPAATTKSTGTWETPEERAKKQVYIIKQSCLAQAVASFGAEVKDVEVDDITARAQRFVDWVMAEPELPPFSDMPDDVPY